MKECAKEGGKYLSAERSTEACVATGIYIGPIPADIRFYPPHCLARVLGGGSQQFFLLGRGPQTLKRLGTTGLDTGIVYSTFSAKLKVTTSFYGHHVTTVQVSLFFKQLS